MNTNWNILYSIAQFYWNKKLCKPLPQTSPIITSINRWLFGTDIKKLLPYLLIWLPVAVVSNAISLHGNQFQFRKKLSSLSLERAKYYFSLNEIACTALGDPIVFDTHCYLFIPLHADEECGHHGKIFQLVWKISIKLLLDSAWNMPSKEYKQAKYWFGSFWDASVTLRKLFEILSIFVDLRGS